MHQLHEHSACISWKKKRKRGQVLRTCFSLCHKISWDCLWGNTQCTAFFQMIKNSQAVSFKSIGGLQILRSYQ